MRLHPEDVRAIAEQVAALLASSRAPVAVARDLSTEARRAVLAMKLKAEQKGRKSV